MRPQIEQELRIITAVGYEEYFLVVWNILQDCRTHGIEWITRGSAADSLVCYCLGISDVCPIRFGLYFRRCLNEERMALNKLPDIDIDFPQDRKDDVVDLIFAKYGRDHCAVVGGFSTFQAKSAFAEVAKVLGMAEREVRRFTAYFPWSFGGGWVSDEHTPSGGPRLRELLASSPENADLPLNEEGLIVIPILCEPCAWNLHPWLKTVQVRPFEAKALSTLSDTECERTLRRHATEIAEELSRVALTELSALSTSNSELKTYLDIYPLARGSGLREEKLIGREQELALLDLAFAQPHSTMKTIRAVQFSGRPVQGRRLEIDCSRLVVLSNDSNRSVIAMVSAADDLQRRWRWRGCGISMKRSCCGRRRNAHKRGRLAGSWIKLTTSSTEGGRENIAKTFPGHYSNRSAIFLFFGTPILWRSAECFLDDLDV